MMLSSSAVDRVWETDREPRRDSSPLDSWSPATLYAAQWLDLSQDAGEGQRGRRTPRPASLGAVTSCSTAPGAAGQKWRRGPRPNSPKSIAPTDRARRKPRDSDPARPA